MNSTPKPTPRSNALLSITCERLRTRLGGPRVIHAIVYFPVRGEPIRGQFADFFRRPQDQVNPILTDKDAVWPCHGWRLDEIPAGVSEGFQTYRLGPETLEMIGYEQGASGGEDAVAEWVDLSRELWKCLTPADWRPFAVPASLGPSLANTDSSHDWGRLLHLAAWSGLVPGLAAEIQRFNLADDPYCTVEQHTGSPLDPVDPTPALPPLQFEHSRTYASLLEVDAVAASLLLAEFLLRQHDQAGSPEPSPRSKRPKRTEADKRHDDFRIRQFLHENPLATRDETARETGISPAHVSESRMWKAHAARRRETQKKNNPTGRLSEGDAEGPAG